VTAQLAARAIALLPNGIDRAVQTFISGEHFRMGDVSTDNLIRADSRGGGALCTCGNRWRLCWPVLG